MQRIQKKQIIEDLKKKMVFLVGPRQVGKTWLAKDIAKNYRNSVYLNYDSLDDREIIKKEQWLESTELLILDELHKMEGWKNYLKGVYDTKASNLQILVTGSARLDVFRQSGDSLAGRFYLHHLLPLSLAELKQLKIEVSIDSLLTRGGFPEPYLATSDIEAERWRRQYSDSLIRNDILSFDNIENYHNIKDLFEILRNKVASPISFASIARDLAISPSTVKKYISILEALYVVFQIKPYSKKISRSILKQPKIYFYDTALVRGDEGIKLENLLALSLLKSIKAENNYLGKDKSLHYLRTKNQQEVDFLISDKNNQVENIIELRSSDANLSRSLEYFSKKYDFPGLQLVRNLKQEKQVDGIKVLRLEDYLKTLYL